MWSAKLIGGIAALTLCVIPRPASAQSTNETTGGNTPKPPFQRCPLHRHFSCRTYGVDFKSGGDYFQNIESTDPFTFIQQFNECQHDVAMNYLVNQEDGTEYNCTSTNMRPNNQNMLSTCAVDKNLLTSGEWSILILSNNGRCHPLAAERDFVLSVGTQVTVTVTPTVTISSTTTPVSTVVSTTEGTTTSTGSAYFTITEPGSLFQPTTTVTPTVFTTASSGWIHWTVNKYVYQVQPAVSTVAATCSPLSRAAVPDPAATFIPQIAAQVASSFGITIPPQNKIREVPFDAEERMKQRRARIAEKRLAKAYPAARKQKRDIDPATVTVDVTNPASFVTQTTTLVAPTTVVATSYVTDYVTVVTNPFQTTVYEGVTSLQTTVTAAPVTVTLTQWGWWGAQTNTITTTANPWVFVVQTPAAAASACNANGGIMKHGSGS